MQKNNEPGCITEDEGKGEGWFVLLVLTIHSMIVEILKKRGKLFYGKSCSSDCRPAECGQVDTV